MMESDIEELNKFFTEIENLTSNPIVRAKCHEAKLYIQVLVGGVRETV